MEWGTTIVGIAISALIAWLISWFYYRRSSRDQNELRDQDKKQRSIDQERIMLFSNRESNFDLYHRDPQRPWDITMNTDKYSFHEITLTSRRNTIQSWTSVSIHVPNQKEIRPQIAFKEDVQHGDEIKVKLPHGLDEVDGLQIRTFTTDSTMFEIDVVPIHPIYTMPDYKDPRIQP